VSIFARLRLHAEEEDSHHRCFRLLLGGEDDTLRLPTAIRVCVESMTACYFLVPSCSFQPFFRVPFDIPADFCRLTFCRPLLQRFTRTFAAIGSLGEHSGCR
jgi:hypothetical protein